MFLTYTSNFRKEGFYSGLLEPWIIEWVKEQERKKREEEDRRRPRLELPLPPLPYDHPRKEESSQDSGIDNPFSDDRVEEDQPIVIKLNQRDLSYFLS